MNERESDLRCIASILINEGCSRLSCYGHGNVGGALINDSPCPIYSMGKSCRGARPVTEIVADAYKWMKKNGATKADLFEYMF